MKAKMVFCAVLLAAGFHRSASADVQIGVGISLPGVQIGVNVPAYPQLLPVPGFPVYYAPYLDLNLFFYDGYYWVFTDGNWYYSTWYDGPWMLAAPDYVPYFLLRVPVSYYRRPPPFFRGWDRHYAPRWGEHFGYQWRERHRDWDRWNQRAMPPRAPLPTYQRNFRGPRYPSTPEQRRLQERYYHYRGQQGRFQPGQPDRSQQRGQPGRFQPGQPGPNRGASPQRPGPGGPRYQGYGRPSAPPQASPRALDRPVPGGPPGSRGQPEGRRQGPMYRTPPGGPRPQAQQRREGPRGPQQPRQQNEDQRRRQPPGD